MVQKRVEKYRRQALKRVIDEAHSIDPTVTTGADAFGLVVAKQYAALMDSEKPVMDQVVKLHQVMTGQDSQRANEPAPSGVVQADPETLLRLVELIEQHDRHAAEQARAVDAD